MAELTPVREAHRFDEAAAAAYLTEHVDGFDGALTVRQFEGGQSNPTFLLAAGGREYVLRKQPPGELLPSAHQVDREHRERRQHRVDEPAVLDDLDTVADYQRLMAEEGGRS